MRVCRQASRFHGNNALICVAFAHSPIFPTLSPTRLSQKSVVNLPTMVTSVRQRAHIATKNAIENDSEDELQDRDADKLPSPNSAAENTAPAMRKPGRSRKTSVDAPPAKITSTRGRRLSSSSVLAPKKAGVGRKPAPQRAVLTDISNTHNASDTEEVDEFDPPEHVTRNSTAILPTPMTVPKTRGRKPKASKDKEEAIKPPGRRGKTVSATVQLDEIPETQQEIRKAPEPARKKLSADGRTKSPAREIIPDTQPEPMIIQASEDHQMEEAQLEEITPRPGDRLRPGSRAQKAPLARARGVSASVERRSNDPTLRRQLDDMTSRFELLEVKYKTLKDIAGREADMNFDKLKRLADEKTKGLLIPYFDSLIYQYANAIAALAASELISTLRSDLTAQTALSTELASMRKEQASTLRQNEQLALEKKQLQSSLHDAQNEIKTLQAKLTATRASSSVIHSTEAAPKFPGSAVKPSHGVTRTLLVGSAEAAKDAQKRILKEELYGDLTGLILRDVKRNEDEGEDVYDCIQTGRNGSEF